MLTQLYIIKRYISIPFLYHIINFITVWQTLQIIFTRKVYPLLIIIINNNTNNNIIFDNEIASPASVVPRAPSPTPSSASRVPSHDTRTRRYLFLSLLFSIFFFYLFFSFISFSFISFFFYLISLNAATHSRDQGHPHPPPPRPHPLPHDPLFLSFSLPFLLFLLLATNAFVVPLNLVAVLANGTLARVIGCATLVALNGGNNNHY